MCGPVHRPRFPSLRRCVSRPGSRGGDQRRFGYLNPQDSFGQLGRVLTAVDAPQRFVLSGNYALPFFKGSCGVAKALLGGWQFNGTATWQSGLPIGVPGNAVSTGINPAFDSPSRSRWFNTCSLTLTGVRQNCASASETPAFTVQAPFTLRTLSTRFPNIRTARPGILDFSIFKSFVVKEDVRLEFRAESFNAFNTPWFGAPNLTLGGGSFGVIGPAQQNDPRSIQLALRLTF